MTRLRWSLIALSVIAVVFVGFDPDLWESALVPTTFLMVFGWLAMPGLKWYRKCAWDNYGDFDGRASREEYGMFMLWNLLIFSALWALAIYVQNILLLFLVILYFLFQTIPTLSVTCRRLHDQGFSGWWQLISGIPIANAILMIGLFCNKGNPFENKYRPVVDRKDQAANRVAAEQGDADAQYNLALNYAQGQGVKWGGVQAHMWLSLAASRLTGEKREQAVGERDRLRLLMTREQIADAQQLASEWEAEHPREP